MRSLANFVLGEAEMERFLLGFFAIEETTVSELIVKVMELDVPNKNGRVYTSDAVKQSLLNVPSEIFGEFYPNYNRGDAGVIDLNKISHICSNFCIRDGALWAKIKVLDTPAGKMLESALSSEQDNFRPRGLADIENGVVKEFEMISVDYVINPA